MKDEEKKKRKEKHDKLHKDKPKGGRYIWDEEDIYGYKSSDNS